MTDFKAIADRLAHEHYVEERYPEIKDLVAAIEALREADRLRERIAELEKLCGPILSQAQQLGKDSEPECELHGWYGEPECCYCERDKLRDRIAAYERTDRASDRYIKKLERERDKLREALGDG